MKHSKVVLVIVATVVCAMVSTADAAAQRRSGGGRPSAGSGAPRGGVSRDQRKKMQFGFGGGLRLGPLGLDVGFWTHSNSFADKRAITMATSISLY